MKLLQLEPPICEPVTEDEAKLYLRVEHYLDDNIIRTMIASARIMAEQYTGRTLMEQKWRVSVNSDHRIKNGRMHIELPMTPFQSLNGRPKIIRPTRIIELSTYRLQEKSGFATVVCDAYLCNTDVLQVEFTVGYGATPEAVPASFKQAILMLVAEMYENRSGGNNSRTVPVVINGAVKSLLDPHRVFKV